jgi:hypothetical protein
MMRLIERKLKRKWIDERQRERRREAKEKNSKVLNKKSLPNKL